MASKRKRPEREWEWEELCEEVRSRSNLGEGVVEKIAKGANLAAHENELAALLPKLADDYVINKAVETANRDMKLPPSIRTEGNRKGGDALFELFETLEPWWNEKRPEEPWIKMKFHAHDNSPKTIAAALFVKIAQGLDDRVTFTQCYSAWKRATPSKSPWREKLQLEALEPEQYPDIAANARPNPPKLRKRSRKR